MNRNNDQRNGGNYQTIPPRWLKCPRRGELIAGKFIPFKTPLDERYESQMAAQDLFTPQMFISLVATYKVKLGLWIDLTFTSRFYNKKIVEENHINYFKFQCRGHDECPTGEQTLLFIEVCDKFISKNPLDVIAVHCTHGFNRTGFLICAYLIEKLDWSVEAAVNAFAKSRPPGIYKQEYINELFSRYGDIEDAPSAPPLPDWCHELNDEDDEGVHISNKSTNSNHYDSHKRKPFMEGVNGVKEVTNPSQIRFVQQKCQELCQYRKNGFPGSQPVSMDVNNKHLISEKEYMVSWKADGNRYMMFVVGANQIYFIDRDNTVFSVEGITFPKRKDSSKHLENTLMDGEMILDVVNGNKVPRYLIYDIITYESQNVGGTDFRRRLLCIDKEIIGPREKAKEEGIIDRSREPFGIRKKDFWELKDTFKIFGDNFKRNLTHEIDGLIFQPVADPYLAGQCHSVLKWKPPSHNSVDFRLKIYREERPGMLKTMIGNLYVGPPNNKIPFAAMKVKKDLKEYDNKIIECTFNMATNEWVFMRERTDKSFPNSYDTAVAVCNSIRFPITKEVLLDFIEKEGWKPRVVKRPNSQQDNNFSGTDRNLMPPPIKTLRKS